MQQEAKRSSAESQISGVTNDRYRLKNSALTLTNHHEYPDPLIITIQNLPCKDEQTIAALTGSRPFGSPSHRLLIDFHNVFPSPIAFR